MAEELSPREQITRATQDLDTHTGGGLVGQSIKTRTIDQHRGAQAAHETMVDGWRRQEETPLQPVNLMPSEVAMRLDTLQTLIMSLEQTGGNTTHYQALLEERDDILRTYGTVHEELES